MTVMTVMMVIVFLGYMIGSFAYVKFVLSGEGKDERGQYILSKAFTNSFIMLSAGYVVYLCSKLYLDVSSQTLDFIVMSWMSAIFFTIGLTIFVVKKRV
ncbi:hypothetical protein ACFFJY_14265 [Fictibacillus aquaticus]|uniref:DUF2178 domain-containing protein n=1 Tax=Fictibacillus aquaticus TaxID=2021314 RepID=A0A235FDA4_9BACL|nr:hypothetical protein [Fictibacillus aquaticus]OYD59380.1 hypothetical protein CGZ90_05685 [Fictibacillus aquaticus]